MIRMGLIGVLFLTLIACQTKKTEVEEENVAQDEILNALTLQIANNVDAPEAYLKRAEYYYENESFELAIADLQLGLLKDSTHLESLHLLADVYLDYFQSRQAIETLDKTAQLHPDNILTLLKKSEFHLILKQYEESMQAINQVLQKEPQNAEAYFMFGLNFIEQGDTARAINSFQTAVENDPDLIDGWIKLGQLQAAIGNSIASKYFDSAIRIQPNNITVRHAKADYLSDQGQLQEAIQVYREIVQIAPDYEDAYYNSGLIFLDMDSIPKAYDQFDICIKNSPLHIRAYYYRGLSAEFLGKLNQAKSDYEQALGLAPDFAEAQEALVRVGNQLETQ